MTDGKAKNVEIKREEKHQDVVHAKAGKAAAPEFVETVIEVRRVAKVVTGGRRLTFSALVVVGDGKGRVGLASSKSREFASAVSKAAKRAKKEMFEIPFYNSTIPFQVTARHGASTVLLRSASKGTGLIAGGAVRSLLQAVGVKDVLGKILGASNKHNVAKATVIALQKLRSAHHIARLRGKKLSDLVEKTNVVEAQ